VPDDERRVPEGSRFRNGYRLLLGRRSQGVTGSASNGAGHNGASLNGETLTGKALNGSSVNGSSRNGHHGHGITVGGHVLPIDVTEGSVDLLEVQADDLLIDTVGTGLPTPDCGDGTADHRHADDRLVALLAAWRAEVDATPIPELVDLDTAVAAVLAGVRADAAAARRRRSARARHLAPLAAAAALIVTTVAGIGMGSQNAVPGDTLWPVQKMFNSERAESVEAKVEVEVRLEKVRGALTHGDQPAAAAELAAIRSEIPEVRTEEGQPLLVQEEEFLAAKLEDTPPGAAADLSTPALSKPDARPTSVPTDDPADPSADADPAESTTPSTAPSEATSSVEPSAEPSGSTTAPAQSSGTSTSPAPDAGLNPSGLPGQTAPGLLGPGGTVTSGPSGTTTSGSAGTNVNATGRATAR
jgi:hypothetical protein